MKRITIRWLLCAALPLGGCRTGVRPPEPGQTAADGLLLADTMRVLDIQQARLRGDGCADPYVERVRRGESDRDFQVDRSGGILRGKVGERWTVNRCGRRIEYAVTFVPDGAGGSWISMKQLKPENC